MTKSTIKVVVLASLLAVGCGPKVTADASQGAVADEEQDTQGLTDGIGVNDAGDSIDGLADLASISDVTPDASADEELADVDDGTGETDGSVTEVQDAPSTDQTGDEAGSGDALGDAPTATDASDVASDSPDQADGLPTTEPAGPGCNDKRQSEDDKIPNDSCWNPPQHYCSAQSNGDWYGCSPDASVCCLTYCRPCGWHPCPTKNKGTPTPTPTIKCPKFFDYNDQAPNQAECLPYMANKTIFCWDKAPSEWKSTWTHENDGDPAP